MTLSDPLWRWLQHHLPDWAADLGTDEEETT